MELTYVMFTFLGLSFECVGMLTMVVIGVWLTLYVVVNRFRVMD